MMSVCYQSCSFRSEVGMRGYEGRFLLLEHIYDSWRTGETVELTGM